jgi:hypothetical protein
MGTFLCAEGGGGSLVVANRGEAQGWETFNMSRIDADTITLQASNGQYVCAEKGGGSVVAANRGEAQQWERFRIFVDHNGLISLQCNNGQFLCAEPHGVLLANRNDAREWESFRVISPDLANCEQTQIQVNVYKIVSAPFWHTGTVIDETEYYFQTTNQVESCVPKGMRLDHHRTIARLIPGNIDRIRTIRDQVINRWNGTRYDLGGHNCNFFTDDLLNSLGTAGLDREYLDASGLAKGLRQIPGGATVQELIVKWPISDKRLDQAFMEDLRRLAHLPGDVRDEIGRIGGTISDIIRDIPRPNVPLPSWPRPW